MRRFVFCSKLKNESSTCMKGFVGVDSEMTAQKSPVCLNTNKVQKIFVFFLRVSHVPSSTIRLRSEMWACYALRLHSGVLLTRYLLPTTRESFNNMLRLPVQPRSWMAKGCRCILRFAWATFLQFPAQPAVDGCHPPWWMWILLLSLLTCCQPLYQLPWSQPK